ncbi:MAG: response regulator [Cyanobacteria bacterium P01_D01_bin.156]
MLSGTDILVVDDRPANLEVVTDTLTAQGYTVATAISGERALNRLQKYAPKLILLDVQMPGIDGFETCRQIKENPELANIPIIFLSAMTDTDFVIKGFSLGAVDYITKPFREAELLARVKTHLNLQALTQHLEDKVAERTSKLQHALKQLEHSKLQLVQQEKMSALGQLVAGVAHELNNPINFIHGNLHYVKIYIHNLLALVSSYQKLYPETRHEIEDIAEELDTEFAKTDLPNILDSMKIGTERIRQIVLSLRNFSRIDEADFKAVDIHEGIDSTLMILQLRLKAKPERPAIQVIRDYDNLSPVECYPGQLNQAFMNILANAIDALEEASAHKTFQEIDENPNQITIRTSMFDSKWIKISISDNGIGMSESVQARIFEPFFTTKSVGSGTGMGMPISYQIITEQHCGKLNCFSKPNAGTEFTIQIPALQSRYNVSTPKP